MEEDTFNCALKEICINFKAQLEILIDVSPGPWCSGWLSCFVLQPLEIHLRLQLPLCSLSIASHFGDALSTWLCKIHFSSHSNFAKRNEVEDRNYVSLP